MPGGHAAAESDTKASSNSAPSSNASVDLNQRLARSNCANGIAVRECVYDALPDSKGTEFALWCLGFGYTGGDNFGRYLTRQCSIEHDALA